MRPLFRLSQLRAVEPGHCERFDSKLHDVLYVVDR